MPISRIKTDGIQDDAVTSAKIGDTNVQTGDIATGAVTTAKLDTGAVTSAKLDTNIDIAGTLDVTSTLTADSNATIAGNFTVDTNTLHVDSANNRVGVGTTSPSQAFHTVGEGLFEKASADSVVTVTSTGGSGRSYQIRSQTSGEFYVYDNTAGASRLTVNSSGIVSTTSQPSFWAYLGSNWTSWTPNNQTQVVPFDSEYHDVQGNHNTSNGLFTCPVDGNYVFSFSVYTGVQTVDQIWLVKNGVRQVTPGFAYGSSSGDRAAGTQIIRCSAGDTLGVCPYGSSASTGSILANFHHTYFMGALVS